MTEECEATTNPLLNHSCTRASLKMRLASLRSAQAMLEQGRTEQDALDSFFIADQHGLLTKDRTDLNAEQIFFAKEAGTKQLSLMEIVQEVS